MESNIRPVIDQLGDENLENRRSRLYGRKCSSATRKEIAMINVRRDFPILTKVHNGHPLVYLDNAATTQKPYQ